MLPLLYHYIVVSSGMLSYYNGTRSRIAACINTKPQNQHIPKN